MVKVRENVPVTAAGGLDVDTWLEGLQASGTPLQTDNLRRLCALVAQHGASRLLSGADMAQLVAGVSMDETCVHACLFLSLLQDEVVPADELASLDAEAVTLAQAAIRIGQTRFLELSNSRLLTSEAKDQVENIRRMLVSLIDDPRVAVLKLSERIVALRLAKSHDAGRQIRLAREALWIFAPLANRLGIWRFKWELEDLALRYLDASSYKLIASSLDGRREERERQVEEIATTVAAALAGKGIHAEVRHRAKHIYSIWQKMRSKRIPFDDVYDVRAVRILVDTVGDCYSALGVVHTLWRHVPSEFDDYIANPKENGYQSIHTAVIGPDEKTVEIQIRTYDMHRESEIGVCAHWEYKRSDPDSPAYQSKMRWLRRALEIEEEVPDVAGVLQRDYKDERVYVRTPDGHVLDLNVGATALDFAYRVHTDVGHHATLALIDGVCLPLNSVLGTGQTVEIVTDPSATPQRNWLENTLGYLKTARARSKAYAWFRGLTAEDQEEIGRHLIAEGARRLAVCLPEDLPGRLGVDDWGSLFEAAGRGEIQFIDVAAAITIDQPEQLALFDIPRAEGEDVVCVVGEDREGLLRDLTTVIGNLNMSLKFIDGKRRDDRAIINLTTTSRSLPELANLIDNLRRIPGVVAVERVV